MRTVRPYNPGVSIDAQLNERYQSPAGAAAYRDKYKKSWTRRLSNARELAMIRRALAPLSALERVLDCPCGAGRLGPTLLARARHLTAVDRSAAMVAEAREALAREAAEGRVDFAVASAHALPFEDASFDLVVCHRLIHHVGDAQERHAIFRELARVTRGPVLLSFNDASTLKMRVQALRRRPRRRYAWRPEELAGEAEAAGLVLEPPIHRLAGAFSLVAVGLFRRRA